MFAPSASRPPYYPSYLPPDARELESLYASQSWLPRHGMGAANESWKVEHNVYMNEEKEAEMKKADIQKTTHALAQMKKIMSNASKELKAEKARGMAQREIESTVATSTEPTVLVYTDPHAYAHYMERQNVNLFTLFSFQADKWAMLKNTPFVRYLYQGMFCLDIGRLDDENFDTAMQFLERTPNIHTLMLHDGWHLGTSGSKSAAAFKSKSRGHPMREKSATGGGASGMTKGAIKTFPNEKKVITALELILPTFLMRNGHHLVHLELHGLTLTNWPEMLKLLKRCSNLQRLYLKQCNIGDRYFTDLTLIIKNQLNSLSALQLSSIGLTSISASLICSMIKIQSEKRSVLHWQEYLRQADTPVPSPSILLPNNLSSQGLISIDVSDNNLGEKGVSLICETLARDTWIKAIDISGNGFAEQALKSIIDMLDENKSLLWIQIQGVRDMNVHLDSADAMIHTLARRTSQFDSKGHRITNAVPTNGTSSAKILQQFDPHHKKRAKRLLLLFHQQNIEIARFVTGRSPVTITDDSTEPRSPLQHKFPSPGACHVFDRFFKPNHPAPRVQYDPPPMPSRSPYAQQPRPASAAGSQKKKKKRSISLDETPPPLLSPMIRGIAAKRAEQDAALEAATKRNKRSANGNNTSTSTTSSNSTSSGSSSARPPPSPPLAPSLNFLFPQLRLVCPTERLMHPDISLRAKPARTDNQWTPKQPTAQKQTPAQNENTDALTQSHFDFRPALRESCVASTVDFINTEKALYKRKMKLTAEHAGMSRIRALASSVDGLRPSSVDTSIGSSGSSNDPARHLSFDPNDAQRPTRDTTPTNAQEPFKPLKGLLKKVETQLTHLGQQVETDQTRVVRNLKEENERLAKEMERVERMQKNGTSSSFARPKPLSPSSSPSPSPPPAAPLPPVSASPNSFDLDGLTAALTAATQASVASGQPADPTLLNYLEQQFERLHAYMDLLEHAPEEQLAHIEAQYEQQHQDEITRQHQQPPYDQPDEVSHPYDDHRTRFDVSRVDQSSTPPPLLVADASSQPRSGVVSRDLSDADDDDPNDRSLCIEHAAYEVEAQPENTSRSDSSRLEQADADEPHTHHQSHSASDESTNNATQGELQTSRLQAEIEETPEDIQEDLSTAVSERMTEMYGLQD